MEHTKEPWSYKGFIYIDNGGKVRQIVGANGNEVVGEHGLCDYDASRIVACVNACAGFSNEELEGASLQKDSIDAQNEIDSLRADIATADQDSRQKQARIDRIERERDELLAALKSDSSFVILHDLVLALEKTNWSSWQTTAKFDAELSVASEFISSVKDGAK